jgi:glycine/D-amino acid oxidase-like deaminating enzyme
MRIAIIGAGFSGLATAWHLLHSKDLNPLPEIVVFDPLGIGEGTSGMAAGLMHPYAGAHSKLNRWGLEGMKESIHLLESASNSLGKPVADYCGLLRIASTEAQKKDFENSSTLYEDITWQDIDKCKSQVPGVISQPGIFIKSSITVHSKLYLEGLWFACQKKGAVIKKTLITNLDELEKIGFDIIVVAAGAWTKKIIQLVDIPVKAVKGQILEIEWPHDKATLPFPLNSHAYLAMDLNRTKCLVGATYERDFNSEGACREFAVQDIMPKAISIYPALYSFKILDCRAGLRASAPDHLPWLKRVNSKTWVITGMGSKGLLYHALYGKQCAKEIIDLFR